MLDRVIFHQLYFISLETNASSNRFYLHAKDSILPSPTFVINGVSVQLGSGTETSLNLSRSMRCLTGSGKTIFSQEVGSGNDDKESESKEQHDLFL